MAVHERYQSFLSDQRQFFDELITEDWDTYDSEDWDTIRNYEVAALLESVRPRTILDIGCGCGFHDLAMARYNFVEAVDAIDYSPRSIERAEKSFSHRKIKRYVADFRQLSVRDHYDLVVSFQVFEHLENPEEFVTANARLCKKGGHVAIYTPNRLRFDNFVRSMRGQPLILCDPMHFREYVPTEIISMARNYGLVRERVIPVGFNGGETFNLATWPAARRISLGRLLPWWAAQFGVLLRRQRTSR
jgi:2-polyprenyl-3-methyl-5-hydroxy-6-metoxy-1,4-benzoquinol methylase